MPININKIKDEILLKSVLDNINDGIIVIDKDLNVIFQNESMEKQRSILDQTIEEWKGDVEQLDDILVIGRRF